MFKGGSGVQGFVFGVSDYAFRVSGFGFRASGSEFRVSYFGIHFSCFSDSGFMFRVSGVGVPLVVDLREGDVVSVVHPAPHVDHHLRFVSVLFFCSSSIFPALSFSSS